MAEHSTIEWTDATWNPITGCSVVSPGCTNCYAMRLAGTRLRDHPSRAGLTRDSKAGPVWSGEVRFNEQWLDQPLNWKRPRMIFVCAHGDLFHESVPDAWIDKVFAIMAAAHWHTFQVLTKRADRMARYFAGRGIAAAERWVAASWGMVKTMPALERTGWTWAQEDMPWPVPNVWLGISAEDQPRADERIPYLLATLAAVRWVSAEPLLGPIWMATNGRFDDGDGAYNWLVGDRFDVDVDANGTTGGAHRGPRVDWVVAGGESGPGARPMHPDWARSLRDQCASAGVPFHFKQWGAWQVTYDRDKDDPDWRRCDVIAQLPGQWLNMAGGQGFHGERVVRVQRAGKAAAGRLLDGAEHNGMPSRSGR